MQIKNVPSIKFLFISYHNPFRSIFFESLSIKREKVYLSGLRGGKEIALAPTMNRAGLIAGYLMGERNYKIATVEI